MTNVVPLRRVAPNTEAVLALEQAYYRLKARAELEPSLDNMRAAVEAYDRWAAEFLGVAHG